MYSWMKKGLIGLLAIMMMVCMANFAVAGNADSSYELPEENYSAAGGKAVGETVAEFQLNARSWNWAPGDIPLDETGSDSDYNEENPHWKHSQNGEAFSYSGKAVESSGHILAIGRPTDNPYADHGELDVSGMVFQNSNAETNTGAWKQAPGSANADASAEQFSGSAYDLNSDSPGGSNWPGR